MTMKPVLKEWFIEAPWGKIALVSWGSERGARVLLVHGRQDSAATFAPLLALLPADRHYVAADLPGHGLSDPFPIGIALSRIHFVTPIDIVVQHLKWKSFTYMSHSMGGEIGLFYNAAHPNIIKKFIHLDIGIALHSISYKPYTSFFEAYEKYYDNYEQFNVDDRVYTARRALQAVMAARGVPERAASVVLARNLRPAHVVHGAHPATDAHVAHVVHGAHPATDAHVAHVVHGAHPATDAHVAHVVHGAHPATDAHVAHVVHGAHPATDAHVAHVVHGAHPATDAHVAHVAHPATEGDGAAPGEQLYRLSWDKRLKNLTTLNLTYDQSVYLFTRNIPPTLFIAATESVKKYENLPTDRLIQEMQRTVKHFTYRIVEGAHDVHLTNPELIADDVTAFLNADFVKSKL